MKQSENRIGGAVTLILFIFIFLPLLAVILNAIFPGIFFGKVEFNGFHIIFDIFERKLWYVSLKNSVTLGIGAATFGTLLGGVLATIRSKWDYTMGRWLDIAVWVLLIAPSFMIAQGWVLFASSEGLANSVLGWSWVTSFIFQPIGLIFVMGLTKFPLAYLTVVAAMEWNVSRFEHAARLNGARPFTVWRTVQLPLSLPAYIAGWTLVFIDTIGDFGLPAALATVYRFPTLPYSIYSAINQSPVRFDMAGVLSFYLVLILALAMALLFIAIQKSKVDFLNSTAIRVTKKKPNHAWLLNIGTVAFLLLCLGVPIGTSAAVSFMKQLGAGIRLDNFTLAHYIAVLGGGDKLDHAQLSIMEGLRNSLTIAAIAAVISVILGFIVAYVLTFTNSKLKGSLHVFTLISLAVPGVVLGIGYIFIWNQRWLEPIGLHLYGKPALLVMAAVAGAIPYAVRVQLGTFANLSPSLLNAAAVQGASTWTKMRTIILPIVRNTLLIAMLASFGTSVFDLATASMLKPPNFVLLPLVIDEAFEFAKYGYATAASVLGGTVVVLLIIVVQFVFHVIFKKMDQRDRKEVNAVVTNFTNK
ncbi:ABC transporter permease [Pseudogracilibacillus auburnensis]|uniref:ABC transporter permease n=1 Tax=Pseudogracilibacillus auburnensis TaxID=1494959 RepID=UPI001A963501|nr:ABC transporter permease subunit [Pseudogracilibacillus auburnensis]MBO1001775.1 iron ABC transporter permease [Pseudogracilibacillus auburnensis]